MFVLIVNRSIAISNICSDAQGNGSNIKNNEGGQSYTVFIFYYFTKKDFRLKYFCEN